MEDVKIITLSMPYKLGTVNCYLVETGTGSVLIDTGSSNRRAELEGELTSAGCKPGDLKLIVLTHPSWMIWRPAMPVSKNCGLSRSTPSTPGMANRSRSIHS
jgi:hypothetical protein